MLSINLVFDSLSIAYLGCYGSECVQTPAIDRFAHEGFVFDHAFSRVSDCPTDAQTCFLFADPKHCTPLSGPGLKLVWFNDQSVAFAPPAFEVGRMTEGSRTSLEGMLRSALAWLDDQCNHGSSHTILWVEIALSPSTWEPTTDRLAVHLDGRDPFDLRGEFSGTVGEEISVEELDSLRDTYAARIEEVDSALGEFFDGLRARGLYDDATIALTSDRGWPMGEHELVGEAPPRLHEELDHVPFILKSPIATSSGRSPALVIPADLGSTLWELMWPDEDEPSGWFIPDRPQSLVPILKGEPVALREYVVSVGQLASDDDDASIEFEEWAIRTQNWKLILPLCPVDPERPRQLYEKPEDRWEFNDLAEQKPDIADHLELQLRRYMDLREFSDDMESLPPLRRDILTPTD